MLGFSSIREFVLKELNIIIRPLFTSCLLVMILPIHDPKLAAFQDVSTVIFVLLFHN